MFIITAILYSFLSGLKCEPNSSEGLLLARMLYPKPSAKKLTKGSYLASFHHDRLKMNKSHQAPSGTNKYNGASRHIHQPTSVTGSPLVGPEVVLLVATHPSVGRRLRGGDGEGFRHDPLGRHLVLQVEGSDVGERSNKLFGLVVETLTVVSRITLAVTVILEKAI